MLTKKSSQEILSQLNSNFRFLKIIKYTLENYFNVLIDNFPNQIKKIEESFYISFYLNKCSCEKKTYKNKFHIIFNIKKDIDLNTIFNCNNNIILIDKAKIKKHGNPFSCKNFKDEEINIYIIVYIQKMQINYFLFMNILSLMKNYIFGLLKDGKWI